MKTWTWQDYCIQVPTCLFHDDLCKVAVSSELVSMGPSLALDLLCYSVSISLSLCFYLLFLPFPRLPSHTWSSWMFSLLNPADVLREMLRFIKKEERRWRREKRNVGVLIFCSLKTCACDHNQVVKTWEFYFLFWKAWRICEFLTRKEIWGDQAPLSFGQTLFWLCFTDFF